MLSGTIRMWNNSKGYGFISPDRDGCDVFVHISAFQQEGIRSVSEGDRFSYEEGIGRNGKSCAINISRL